MRPVSCLNESCSASGIALYQADLLYRLQTQAQVIAARNEPGDYLSIAWGWGIGFMLAVYVSSGISGAHINPAITISLAVFRKFSWRKVSLPQSVIFVLFLTGIDDNRYLATLLHSCLEASRPLPSSTASSSSRTDRAPSFQLTFPHPATGVYYGPLNQLPNGYASVLTTGPAGAFTSVISIVISVAIGSALLMGSICAFTDTGNNPATPGLTPLLLGLVMVGIASSFGYQT